MRCRASLRSASGPSTRLLEEIGGQLPETWRRPEGESRVVLAPGLPVIETGAGKLKTVIRNLVHNALKFTERGTGRGIPPDALGYIFDMFRQVPGTGGGGGGLGLHLVQRLLQILGGTLNVASEVGRGTCFTITLPARPAGGAARAA